MKKMTKEQALITARKAIQFKRKILESDGKSYFDYPEIVIDDLNRSERIISKMIRDLRYSGEIVE